MATFKGDAPCYVSRAEGARKQMAGSPDAASLPPERGPAVERLRAAEGVFNDLIDEIDGALREAEAAHYGRAADAAKASISEIKPLCEEAATSARVMSDGLSKQARIQHDTFRAIPREGDTLPDGRPVQIHPPEKNLAERTGFDNLPLMDWTSQYEERQDRFRATNAEAQRVMASYDTQTQEITAPPKEPKPQSRPTETSSTHADYGRSASDVMSGQSYSSVPTTTSTSTSTPAQSHSSWASTPTPPPSPTPSVTPTPTQQAPANTSSAWTRGSTPLPPNAFRGSDDVVYRRGPNGGWQRLNAPNGKWAPMPPGQVPPGAPGSAGGGNRGGNATSGGNRAGTPTGGRPGSGSGSDPRPGGQSGRTPTGGRSTPTASTAATGSNSTTGRSAPMRGMPMGGQQNQGDDEETHERPSWLVQTEDVITNDMERTAPPVLGALPGEEGYTGN